ncbi:hypothetical protein RUND412_003749 [Rhizina undulata]
MSTRFTYHEQVRNLVITGTFIDAPAPGALRVRENTKVVVSGKTGRIIYIGENVRGSSPQRMPWVEGENVSHIDLTPGHVICPGFIDCHIHAPQFGQLGTRTDLPLMEWLDSYTLPAEAEFSQEDVARRIYFALVKRLISDGTTTAVFFGSGHLRATQILAEICGAYGQRAFVGRNCSDTLFHPKYLDSTEKCLEDTENFIQFCRSRWEKDGLIRPVITPRFIPSCSDKLLHGLGNLAKKYDCMVQSHAVESVDEMEMVGKRFSKRDINVFKDFGLLTNKTLLAHCCHLNMTEARKIVDAGASIVTCPYSNMLFARATVPVPRFHELGLKIGMGTDIAGGMSSSMLTNIRLAVLQDRVDAFTPVARTADDPKIEVKEAKWIVDYKYGFHLATTGGAKALGLEKDVGAFEVGMKWDALLVDTIGIDLSNKSNKLGYDVGFLPQWAEVREGFEKFINCGDDRNILKVWVDGYEVLGKS